MVWQTVQGSHTLGAVLYSYLVCQTVGALLYIYLVWQTVQGGEVKTNKTIGPNLGWVTFIFNFVCLGWCWSWLVLVNLCFGLSWLVLVLVGLC